MTFTATADPDGTPAVIADTADVRFVCATGSDQQCLEVTISGEVMPPTFQHIPGAFNLLPTTVGGAAKDQFTFNTTGNQTGYIHNQNDVLTVRDVSGNGNWAVQIHATAFAKQEDPNTIIPLDKFYLVTTEPQTGTQQDVNPNDGIEYLPASATPQNIEAPLNVPITAELFGNPLVFTTQNATFGTRGTPGAPIVIMSAPTAQGRIGDFSQAINYYLQIPAAQPTGTYTTTITYDLIYPI